jgi:hypothetical protein
MRRAHHLSAVIAGLVFLVALSAPWFSFRLPTGITLIRSGLESGDLGAALVAASVASYGAALLVRGLVRRFLGLLQAIMAMGSFLAWLMILQEPLRSVATEIISLTGVEGAQAFVGVVMEGPTWGFYVGLVGCAVMAVSGLAGLLSGDKAGPASRYRRGPDQNSNDSVSTWDCLSEGGDPTTR